MRRVSMHLVGLLTLGLSAASAEAGESAVGGLFEAIHICYGSTESVECGGLERHGTLGFGVALVFERNLGDGVRLRAAPGYAPRGFDSLARGTHYEVRHGFLELPVQLKLRTGSHPFYAVAGPSLGYRIRTISVVASGRSETPSDVFSYGDVHGATRFEQADRWKRFQLALQAGIGLELEAGRKGRIFAELLYELGLTHLYDGPRGFSTTTRIKDRSSGSHFRIGVTFGSKRGG